VYSYAYITNTGSNGWEGIIKVDIQTSREATENIDAIGLTLQLAPQAALVNTWGYEHQTAGNTVLYNIKKPAQGDIRTILLQFLLPAWSQGNMDALASLKWTVNTASGASVDGSGSISLPAASAQPVPMAVLVDTTIKLAGGIQQIGQIYYDTSLGELERLTALSRSVSDYRERIANARRMLNSESIFVSEYSLLTLYGDICVNDLAALQEKDLERLPASPPVYTAAETPASAETGRYSDYVPQPLTRVDTPPLYDAYAVTPAWVLKLEEALDQMAQRIEALDRKVQGTEEVAAYSNDSILWHELPARKEEFLLEVVMPPQSIALRQIGGEGGSITLRETMKPVAATPGAEMSFRPMEPVQATQSAPVISTAPAQTAQASVVAGAMLGTTAASIPAARTGLATPVRTTTPPANAAPSNNALPPVNSAGVANNAPAPANTPLPVVRIPPEQVKIIPAAPNPGSTRVYIAQVAACKTSAETRSIVDRLFNAGLTPSVETYQDYFRITVGRVRQADLAALVTKIGSAGFSEVWLRVP
jgi:hypothetical protein